MTSATGESTKPALGASFNGRIKLDVSPARESESARCQEGSTTLRDLRVVFIGTDHAVPARHLAVLAAAHSVVAIVESTWRQGWRRFLGGLRPTRLKRFARGHSIPYRLFGPGQRRELSRFLAEQRPDVVCVVYMMHLLPPEALAVPTLGAINLHPALLPAYRGADPFFWQIYDGVEESALTVHLVDEQEDHGPILVQRRFPLPRGITFHGLQDLVGEHGPPALLEAIELLATRGSGGFAPQPEKSPTRRARRVSRQEVRELIDWRGWGIERVWRMVRVAEPPLGLPPTRWRDLGYCPRTEDYERVPAPEPPGSLQRDAGGWYLAHPEGRIRVGYAFAPLEWLKQVVPLERLILSLGRLKRRLGAMFG